MPDWILKAIVIVAVIWFCVKMIRGDWDAS